MDSGQTRRIAASRVTKQHIVVNTRGTPIGVSLSGVNRHDSMVLAATLNAIPPIQTGRRDRPRSRPGRLHGDKAHDHRRCRRDCRQRNIVPRIARCGIESNQKSGRHQWVVDSTLA